MTAIIPMSVKMLTSIVTIMKPKIVQYSGIYRQPGHDIPVPAPSKENDSVCRWRYKILRSRKGILAYIFCQVTGSKIRTNLQQ